MSKRKFLKKVGALLMAAALTMVPLTAVRAANNNLPDPAHKGSITVHKYLRDVDSTIIGTGKELTPEEAAELGTAAEGVKFKLYKVDAGYEVISTTTVADALANATLVSEETTDVDGVCKWVWTQDATGYYVLEEDAETTPEGYTAAPPSIIALPYAVDDDAWNYDIHVYPKNVNDKELIKEVVDEETGYAVGDIVEWQYRSKLDLSKIYDNSNETELFGTYQITDVLDDRLGYDSTGVVTGVGGSSDVTLTPTTHYTVDSTTSQTVVWKLTDAGIKALADVNATGIELNFKTVVLDVAYGESESAEVKNGGTLEWKNEPGTESGDYEIPDEEKPSVSLYNIVIKKTNNDGTKLLDGAKFKIATSKADAIAGTFIQADGADVTVTTKAHPTDAAITGGWAMFAGLPVNTGEDTTFWLVEDVAPTIGDDKYVRPGEPIEVTIKNESGITDAEKLSTTATIKNYLPGDPDIPDKWKLPLTGGMGTMIFYAIGAIVMVGSVILYSRSKRLKNNQ